MIKNHKSSTGRSPKDSEKTSLNLELNFKKF